MKSALLKAREEILGRDAQPARPQEPRADISQDREPLPIYVTDGLPPRADNAEPGWTLDIDDWLRS